MERLTDAMISGGRNLTPTESAQFDECRSKVKVLDGRIEELEAEHRRQTLANQAGGQAVGGYGNGVTGEQPQTYRRGGQNSYFRDFLLAEGHRDFDGTARERLQRHAREIDVDMPARDAKRRQAAEREVRSQFGPEAPSPFERTGAEYRALTRTDGAGGYFVPPLWLVDEYIPYQRAGRVHANQAKSIPLPSGTDTINLPALTTGSQTAAQASDGGSVTARDPADNFVSAGVKTVAGQVDVAMQLLDQSPVAFDQILYGDLMADVNMQIDGQTLLGSGSSGQVLGVMPAGAVNASGQVNQIFTSGSPTLALLYPQIAMLLSQVAKGRMAPATALFMNPSRWYWLVSQLDTQNRPLVVPSADGGQSFNQIATTGTPSFEGAVGSILGVNVYLDANLPVTFGGATTAPSIAGSTGHTAPTAGTGSGNSQDVILAERAEDLFLFEGELRMRSLDQILSGTLQVRLQAFEYLAYLPTRYPSSIGVLSGTGMILPAGY